MALITSFASAGPGIVTAYGATTREYRVDGPGQFFELYKEENFTETRIWVALTEAAAKAQVDLNTQPGGANEYYSWTHAEDRRIVGSYILTREYGKTVTTLLETSEVFAPQFSPVSGTQSKPFNVTISSATSGANIYAAVSVWVPPYLATPGYWDQVTAWSNLGETPKTINVPAGGLHKVWAYAEVTVGSNTYKSMLATAGYTDTP